MGIWWAYFHEGTVHDCMSRIYTVLDNLGKLHLQDGSTSLTVAAQKDHLSVVELLVSVGAQVNSQDNVSH